MLPLAKAGARHKSGQKQSEDVDAVFRVYLAIVVGQLMLEGNASNVIFLVSIVSTTLNYTHRELIFLLSLRVSVLSGNFCCYFLKPLLEIPTRLSKTRVLRHRRSRCFLYSTLHRRWYFNTSE
jgi:hypothetical protein